MNLKLPIQAQCTERILKAVLPPDWKMVNDKNSNGYKYINLLFGVELDEANAQLKELYNDSFITSIDLTKEFELYELNLSGVPLGSYLNSSGIPIKITNETEFYKGSPTRVVSDGVLPLPMYYLTYSGDAVPSGAGFENGFDIGMNTPCWSTVSGIVGLEYIRKDFRGSGYLIVGSDIDQEVAYHSGVYPTFMIDVGSNLKTSGDYITTYGMFPGIKIQDYSGALTNEIISPLDIKTLSGQYPLYRTIQDSGIFYTIDHYEPYHGWTFNANGDAVAIVDYGSEYYYNDIGKKIYYRTAKNNPYGYNNYTTAYLDLLRAPISGTLRVFDIDILDVSGNATEIPYSGKTLYGYKTYLGYESVVPSGMGYAYEGSGCTAVNTTKWEYLHESGGFDDGSLSYIDGSGSITNRLSISGYHSRYMVEYKFKAYDSVKYVSSLSNNGSVSLNTPSPLLTTTDGSFKTVEYEFSRDPNIDQAKLITFNGLDMRPGSRLNKISFDIPYLAAEGELSSNLTINTNKEYIGYSNDFIPQDEDLRYYAVNCYFSNDVSGSLIESDLTGNNNFLYFSGSNPIYKINYKDYFGKKIINMGAGSYYYKNSSTFLADNTYFQFDFKMGLAQSGRLMELRDSGNSKYVYLDIESDGRIKIFSAGYFFYSTELLSFNGEIKNLILKYTPDDISSSVPTFKLYFKEGNTLGHRIINLTIATDTPLTVDTTYLKLFKDMSVDIGNFRIFYEVE